MVMIENGRKVVLSWWGEWVMVRRKDLHTICPSSDEKFAPSSRKSG